MAALNFPDPNVTTSYTNPDTGITYEWANGIWKAVRTAQTAPELFVDVDGDNLTGNLTLGTDKIVLNATDGSAEFAGTIKSTTWPTYGYEIESSGALGLNAAAGTSGNMFSLTVGGTAVASITGQGSATFAGPITLGTWANTSDSAIYMANQADSGQITVKGNGSSSQSAFSVYSGGWSGSSNQVAAIKADGSATFVDYVTSNEGFYVAQTAAPNGSSIFKSWLGSSTYVDILDNGTAEFAGYVKAATNLICDTTSSSNGLYIGDFTNGNYNATIFGNGNATFAGVVVADTGFQSNAYSGRSVGITTTTQGVERALAVEDGSGGYSASLNMDGSATFASQVSTSDRFDSNRTTGTDNVFNGRLNNSLTSKILADGSAEFSGKVETIGNTAAFHVGTDKSASKVPFNIYDTANGNETIARIQGDGSATFAGETNIGGYNGSSNTTDGVLLGSVGGVYSQLAAATAGTGVVFQGMHGSSFTSRITADGSATFAGSVTGDYFFAGRNTTDANLLHASFGYTNATTTLVKGTGIFLGTSLGNANGAVPDGTNLRLLTDGSATFTGNINLNGSTNYLQGQYGYLSFASSTYGAELRATTGSVLIRTTGSAGVVLNSGATSWGAYVSESRLKTIVGDVDADQAWDLVRNIELKRYQYKDEEDQSVPYAGPMADWLEKQDPELVIYREPDETGPIRAFNQGLLDMKALAALSVALKRIETLEQRLSDAGIA